MGRVTHGKRHVTPNHRPDSVQGRLWYQLDSLIKTVRGTPSAYAIILSQRLGQVITRQQVWDLLNLHNMTKKL